MSRWFRGRSSGAMTAGAGSSVYQNVKAGLQELYRSVLLPLEQDFKFHQFFSPLLTDGDFAAKPMVMLIGQYSTGKTSFIQHLLERDYPGLRIGPEPTTDRFVAVMENETEQVVPGNAAVVDPTKPFSQLSNFGNNFLLRFECSMLPCVILNGITLIDTPGVLSGNKQTSRGYDFEGVIQWFAERVDLILLIFDAHKLDISDEFRRCITALRGNDTKIRIILNKADMVSYQQLMRVYGALMWSLGKVIPSPEVARVYIGSFWNQPLQNDENRKLFEAEANDLYADIARLPRDAAIRKVNDFIKRARLAKVHAYLLTNLRKQLPMWGKEAKKKQLLNQLQQVYQQVSTDFAIPLGDFPPISLMQEKLAAFDWNRIPKLDSKRIEALDLMIKTQIPQLMALIPAEEAQAAQQPSDGSVVETKASPFLSLKSRNAGSVWMLDKFLNQPVDVERYRADFESLGPDTCGRINGTQAKADLVKSKLPSAVLHRVWNLADITRDGYLDLYEYALARRFIEMKLEGFELPASLPEALLPSFDPHGASVDTSPSLLNDREASFQRESCSATHDSLSRRGSAAGWSPARGPRADAGNPLGD
ncbi:sarcalumenin/eps15 family protein [Besnoitia besnoiti]|uniref:Sarcalumenin/eps15 family protein n=1 Tax=Besnoitia besnoiti TaxID=94643 RepID=A0A2A9MQZ1_BESBE|nr:sarcalumenin/eps15 family protein [Besnoitia besnoiti]PFH38660.1 sarcalumenin/eps15 family protein [Besnoitia besnoiti]